jgi:superfamily II DNA/RNA helicase
MNSWDKMGNIKEELLRGIMSIGFEVPSPIQEQSISKISKGDNIIAQAQSGTGKTGAFVIGTLNQLDVTKSQTQILVIAPTRELITQIASIYSEISKYMVGIKIYVCVGGEQINKDLYYLNRNTPHIICGTPGRLLHLLEDNKIMSNINTVVCDELDVLFSTDFDREMNRIFSIIKYNQLCLFSATMHNVAELNHLFDSEPETILVKADMLTLEGINQYYIALEHQSLKYDTLKDIYKRLAVSQCIIYCNSVKTVDYLYDRMIHDDFPVICIHSKMSGDERKEAYNNFKSGSSRILISTDLTSRGIDIQQVSIVVNYDFPKNIHTYLHRIGRSGRWGRKGTGINFITNYDSGQLREVETYYNTDIKELPAEFIELA